MAIYSFDKMPMVVKSVTEAMKAAVSEAVKTLALDGITTMIDLTPVDTTRAVSNWRAQLTTPAKGEVQPIVPGSVKGSGASVARAVAKTRAVSKVTGAKNVNQVFITNNVPYISVLEYGDAKHRPNGMVSKGLQVMKLRASSIQILKK